MNENANNLKAHLHSLQNDVAQTGEVDEELHTLLRQLDGDIRTLLDQRSGAAAGLAADPTVALHRNDAAETATVTTDGVIVDNPNAGSTTYGLAERTQELSARFAVEHPHLEPALRQLGNLLSNMGI